MNTNTRYYKLFKQIFLYHLAARLGRHYLLWTRQQSRVINIRHIVDFFALHDYILHHLLFKQIHTHTQNFFLTKVRQKIHQRFSRFSQCVIFKFKRKKNQITHSYTHDFGNELEPQTGRRKSLKIKKNHFSLEPSRCLNKFHQLSNEC